MQQDKQMWIVERRRLGQEEPYSWDAVACAIKREEAEHMYRRMTMFIQCHEMRLLTPDGQVALYYCDPSSMYRSADPMSAQNSAAEMAGNPNG